MTYKPFGPLSTQDLWIPSVTPGFKEQSWVYLIHAPKKTTYIITECIEINVTKHQSIYYIAEDLLQSKRINIERTKNRRRQSLQESGRFPSAILIPVGPSAGRRELNNSRRLNSSPRALF
jgi:hypothetical protein